MAHIKTVGLVWIRKVMREKGPEVENVFLARLTPEERTTLEQAFPVSTAPIETVTDILYKAAEMLFPGDPLAVRKLLRGEARNDLTGIYRVLLHVVSIEYAVKQAALLWKTYNKKGEAHIERPPEGGNRLIEVVTGYPDMYWPFAEVNAGYIEGVMEMTGAKDVAVECDLRDPEAWKWIVTWR